LEELPCKKYYCLEKHIILKNTNHFRGYKLTFAFDDCNQLMIGLSLEWYKNWRMKLTFDCKKISDQHTHGLMHWWLFSTIQPFGLAKNKRYIKFNIHMLPTLTILQDTGRHLLTRVVPTLLIEASIKLLPEGLVLRILIKLTY
jgi:hypothetical protein